MTDINSEEYKKFLIEWPEWNDEFPCDMKRLILYMYYQDYCKNYCRCGIPFEKADRYVFYHGCMRHYCSTCRVFCKMTSQYAISNGIIDKIENKMIDKKWSMLLNDDDDDKFEHWRKTIDEIIDGKYKSQEPIYPQEIYPFWYIFRLKFIENKDVSKVEEIIKKDNVYNRILIKDLCEGISAMNYLLMGDKFLSKNDVDKLFRELVERFYDCENWEMYHSALIMGFPNKIKLYLPKYDFAEEIKKIDQSRIKNPRLIKQLLKDLHQDPYPKILFSFY